MNPQPQPLHLVADTPTANRREQRKKMISDYYDQAAPGRDKWIARNGYFHEEDCRFTRFLVPPGLKILDLGCGTGNMLARLEQAGLLAEHLRLMSGPTVLGGDLNAPEASAVVQTLLNTGLRDAFSAAGSGYGYTHGHHLLRGLSFLRIDHILVSKDIGVSDAFAGGREASQHRPVIADLWVHRQ